MHGAGLDVFFVDQLGRLFVGQQLQGLVDLELARLALLLAHLAEHAAQLLGHLLPCPGGPMISSWGRARPGRSRFPCRPAALRAASCEKPGAWHCPSAGASPVRAGRGQQHLQHPLFGRVFGAHAPLFHVRFAGLLDRHFGQVADDGIHILAHIAHLGELGGLHLDEGRIGQPRQAAGNFGLAYAGGPIIRIFFGVISWRSASSTCWRRQRLRRAMATARLAPVCPTMWRSSSLTISLGSHGRTCDISIQIGHLALMQQALAALIFTDSALDRQGFDGVVHVGVRCTARRRFPATFSRWPRPPARCCSAALWPLSAHTRRPSQWPQCPARAPARRHCR